MNLCKYQHLFTEVTQDLCRVNKIHNYGSKF